MASVADWSTTPASNTTLGGISTDGNVTLVNQIDNIFRGMMAEVATSRDDGTVINVYPRGYLFGLTLANNAGDATNDIDIAVGECVTLNSPYWRMALASSLTKRLDAAWAVGTGNGGLDTGSIANTTYHVWLIARSDTGVVDALFSTSATAPTMPANYDRKRRIGSIIRDTGVILPFTQYGDRFLLTTSVVNASGITSIADTLVAMTVPAGIIVNPITSIKGRVNNGSIDWRLGDGNGSASNIFVGMAESATIANVQNTVELVPSNTSSQIRVTRTVTGTVSAASISTWGWIDNRGRF